MSKKAVSTALVAIVVIVAVIGGLAIGVIVPGLALPAKTTTLTNTSTTLFVLTQTAFVPTTQLQTSLSTITQTSTQEQTLTSIATQIETQTQLETTTQATNVTVTTQTLAATSTITEFQQVQGSSTILSNYHFIYPNNDATAMVTTIDEPYAGVIQASFQSTATMHLDLISGSLTESSPSDQTSGSISFPIAANTGYSLTIVNDHCFVICGSGFNVTLTVSYQY